MMKLSRLMDRQRMERRCIVTGVILVVCLLLLLIRLWQVQVMNSAEHARKAARQSIRPVRINPTRGRIFSSDGVQLVGNACKYDVWFHPAEMRQPGGFKRTFDHILVCYEKVVQTVGRKGRLTEASLRRHLNQSPAMPIVVMRDLSPEELFRVWEMSPWLTGMEIHTRLVRTYSQPGLLSQTLGFTGTLHPDGTFGDAEEYPRSYAMDDICGRSGLESFYNKELSGTPGLKLVCVDSIGYARRELPGGIPMTPGNDVILSIDSRLQACAEKLLQGKRGALVLMDIETGEVLTMASSPTFDLSTLSGAMYAKLNADQENLPLLNRALNGVYPPGSILKPLVALAALKTGAITADTTFNCIGYYALGKSRIHCAKKWGHGSIDVYDAITFSCNPFFIAAGLQTGIDALEPMFAAAGLGQKTGIDIAEFARTLCPSRAAAERRYRRKWISADTAFVSMGQGLVLVTPLQMAVYCAALANGGTILRPYLVREIRDTAGRPVRTTQPEVLRTLPANPEDMVLVRAAMSNVVEDPHGSASILKGIVRRKQDGSNELIRYHVAAKTGTAEVGPKQNRYKQTWMIVYGPLPEAKYAFACVVEHGESGSQTVGPIALEFWKEILRDLPVPEAEPSLEE